MECGNTWNERQQGGQPIDNVPRHRDTLDALRVLCEAVIDPLAEALGAPVLTYGFASPRLTAKIRAGIAPRLDQHVACERGDDGAYLCARRGAAVDLAVPGVGGMDLARWLASNTPFDRIYFYGNDRPVHVSYGPDETRAVFEIIRSADGRRFPRRLRFQ